MMRLSTLLTAAGRITRQWIIRRCVGCSQVLSHVDDWLCIDCRNTVRHVGVHCPTCARHVFDSAIPCGYCLQSPPPFCRVYIGYFYEGTVRDVILRAKYGKERAALAQLSSWGRKLALGLSDIDRVVPMPISLSRLVQRGFNQTHYIAHAVADELGVVCEKRALRKANRAPQSLQDSDAVRRRNIRGAFSAGSQAVSGHVLLVDDVMTSGETVRAATQVLQVQGAKCVSVLTIAARRA